MRWYLLPLLALMACSPVMAETLYVQSLEAKLLAQPLFSAPVVVTVKQGTAMELLQTQGRWQQVKTGGKTGWVSKFIVADHPPIKKISVLGAEQESLDSENVRRRASAVTTAGATRGLTDEERRRGTEGSADYDALHQIEAFKVTEDEVQRFLKQGLDQ